MTYVIADQRGLEYASPDLAFIESPAKSPVVWYSTYKYGPPMRFEWDLAKELENIRKHGVSFAEAIETFSDPHGFALSDEMHSSAEQRFYWIGVSKSGRVLTTRYTRREEIIRIFGSAEWRKFRRVYEATKSQGSETK